ncbi:FAD-dependent monooxygenase [Kribbella antibiotica]|uniref:FAD-dependent monooxygenase n=1 Tax=Kribbella antibiotica TaxID=190195 RepID=A0A4R4ZVX4_9ACTN|nr:NAD(P)/FAD-dependent oxidoreductase [Kribbella antibiotica]TDD62209.1 FAD-dependent monooxygenase [Kribbella antibiotica]
MTVRVLIAGGGIGGLCLAQGLRKAGVEVRVFERDLAPDSRQQGYRLNIEPVGSAALHHCLPPASWDRFVATAGDPGPGMGVFDERLHLLMRENSSTDPADPVHAVHAVSRGGLRKILLSGLEADVHFGKTFTGYEIAGSGEVTAAFEDGSTAIGDVLIGADGVRSPVRRQQLPHAGYLDPQAIGIGGKLALTAETEDWLPGALTSSKNMILPPRDFLFTSVFRRRDRQDTTDTDYVMWAYVAHRSTLTAGLTGPRGPILRDHVQARMTGWDPQLVRLVGDSDPDTIERFDFTAGRRIGPWETSQVTLLGDALHPMPPVGGLGGNAALQDARVLCEALTAVDRGERPLFEALSVAEETIRSHGFGAAAEALRYTKLASSRSRALRRTARTFFRVCGLVPPLRKAIFES